MFSRQICILVRGSAEKVKMASKAALRAVSMPQLASVSLWSCLQVLVTPEPEVQAQNGRR